MKRERYNNLRFYYLLYVLILTIIVTIVFLIALKVDYYQMQWLRIVFIFFIIKLSINIICLLNGLKKISKNKHEKNIDERELLIMYRSAAIGGLVAFSFMPFIYAFVFILPKYLVIASVVYVLLVDVSINIASVVYQKKM